MSWAGFNRLDGLLFMHLGVICWAKAGHLEAKSSQSEVWSAGSFGMFPTHLVRLLPGGSGYLHRGKI